MLIAHGDSIKNFNLYPPAKGLTESEFTQCFQDTNDDEKVVQPILTIDHVMNMKTNIEENQIINFINNSVFPQYHVGHHTFDHNHILERDFQENCTMDTLSTISGSMFYVNSIS